MTSARTLTPHRTAGPPSRRANRGAVLAVVSIAQLMLVLDATVVNIALPNAQAALGFSIASRHWVVTAYSLAFGSLLLLGGRITDTLGRRRAFLLGLAGFATASAVGGAAGSFAVLIAARALQGTFGALLAPAALSLLTVTFSDPAGRVRAFSLFGAISAAGGSIGLILGGTLTQYLSWRSVMYVNVIVAAAAAVAAILILSSDRPHQRRPIDLPGAALAAAGVFTIVYGVSRSAGTGPSVLHPMTAVLVGVGMLLLVTFTAVELRTAHPLLPCSIVADRTRAGAVAAMFLSATGVFGVLLFLTYYLQDTLGYSPARTGLAFLPMGATMIVVGSAGNTFLASRISPRVTLPAGLLIAAAGLTLLTRITVHPDYRSVVLPAMLVTAVGLALTFAPALNLGTVGVNHEDAGIASAALQVAQQIGGSVGIATLNTVATSAASHYAAAHLHQPRVSLLQQQADVHGSAIAFWIIAGTFLAAALVVTAFLNPHAGPYRMAHGHRAGALSDGRRLATASATTNSSGATLGHVHLPPSPLSTPPVPATEPATTRS